MDIRVKVTLGLALAVTASLVALVSLRPSHPPELIYQDKDINYWFGEAGASFDTARFSRPMAAFKHFNTNALPFLVEKTETKAGWRAKVSRWARKLGVKRVPFMSAEQEAISAARERHLALIILDRLRDLPDVKHELPNLIHERTP